MSKPMERKKYFVYVKHSVLEGYGDCGHTSPEFSLVPCNTLLEAYQTEQKQYKDDETMILKNIAIQMSVKEAPDSIEE